MYLRRSRPRTTLPGIPPFVPLRGIPPFVPLRGIVLAAFLALTPTTLAGAAIENPAVKAWLEAWSTGAEDDLDSFLTEDTVLQELTLSSNDREGYRNLMRIGRSTLRNVEYTADDLILDGDRGALVWSRFAIHNFSGNPVRIRGVSILHFRDGKIAKEWRVYDRVDFFRQIGAVPGGGDDAPAAEAPAAEKLDDLEPLRQALAFHSSFDAGADADFARGDRRIHTMTRGKPLEATPGLSAEHVTIEESGGRYGGALRFNRPNEQVVLYGDAENLGYDEEDWSGTVSLWMSLDPDEDLTPGLFCDPIQISDAYVTEWDDASLWLSFPRKPPWRLAFGAIPDLETWNPEDTKWSEMPPSDKPQVVVEDQPFRRETWTHVLFTFSGFNRGAEEGVARLYLDGELQGEIRRSQTHTWDPAKAAIQMGLNYVGRVDDLAVFDRALGAAEIEALFALPAGVVRLHPEAP